ncbi:MAG TPA: hypothetical protein VIV12_26320 [Streptosporangiaceae bacterium]
MGCRSSPCSAAARARWVAFRDQLDFHLAAEDAALWPPACARLTGDSHGQVSPELQTCWPDVR